MLVLFVLTIAMMKKEHKTTVEQLKIVEIQNSVKELINVIFYYQDINVSL
jgi:hypothetical protein